MTLKQNTQAGGEFQEHVLHVCLQSWASLQIKLLQL